MYKIAFDSEKYIQIQSEKIMERVNLFDNKLYLEFGGKLFDDYHASRVLPGFAPDMKVKMLQSISDKVEIVISINANDIEKSKTRGDLGITYAQEVLRLIDAFRGMELYVSSVVITQYTNQEAAVKFKTQLERLGMKVYLHYPISGYPTNVRFIVSDDGYGKNDFIETTRPLVVVTAPGPGSGKMATCLSQLYHEYKRGNKAGYAKFETFPVWNLPLKHPVNVAYEAATADIDDVNMIDPFHLEAYGIKTTNYNRDVEIFPVLSTILKDITGEDIYKSPTDMGVNMIGDCLIDEHAAIVASYDEVIRRYYHTLCERLDGNASDETVARIELIMNQAGLVPEQRNCVKPALDKAEKTGGPAVCIELPDGRIVTGKSSSLLGAASACILNALKIVANIDDRTKLISPDVIQPVQQLKTKYLGGNNPRLHVDEILVALSISAKLNPAAEDAMEALAGLKNSEAHSTVILSQVDKDVFRKLGINLTCEPVYHTKKLYHKK